jgi:hypothetical protein
MNGIYGEDGGCLKKFNLWTQADLILFNYIIKNKIG